MFVVLLNWNGGENDPFTSFNATLSSLFEACGKRTRTLQLTDTSWSRQLQNLNLDGIDFIHTYQGLGTTLVAGEKGRNFWETLRVPLISYHGDHPCHMPANHTLDISNCAHIYGTREFSIYSNRHFRKRSRTTVVYPPMLSLDLPLERKSGEFFVLAKNVTAPRDMEAKWQRDFDKRTFKLCMAATESLRPALAQESHVETHRLIDEFLEFNKEEIIHPSVNPDAYHAFHSQLDFYSRNLNSVNILNSLREIPIHVYGRGWDVYAQEANPHHRFFPGIAMAQSQSLYYSRYGIIDVTPSMTGLHDRTLRAMQNRTSFLSSAYMPGFLPDMARFEPLFFEHHHFDLREKCESIMANPDSHAELSEAFSYQYQMRVNGFDFVSHLDLIARSLDRR